MKHCQCIRNQCVLPYNAQGYTKHIQSNQNVTDMSPLIYSPTKRNDLQTSQPNNIFNWSSIHCSMSNRFWTSLRSYRCVGGCLSFCLSITSSVSNLTFVGDDTSALAMILCVVVDYGASPPLAQSPEVVYRRVEAWL